MTIDFTPYVWHDGETGGTLVTAARLNDRETVTKSLVDTVNSLTGSTDPRRDFAPENYDAAGDGVANDRAAVQDAIDAAAARYTATGVRQTVPITGVYRVDAVTYLNSSGTASGLVSLILRDGVTLTGPGIIRVANSAYTSGNLYGVIRGAAAGISHAAVTGITIDGNKTNQPASTQCSNILLEAADDIEIDNTRQVNANGNAIRVRGAGTALVTNVRITRNRITTPSYIGIQVTQFDGIDISENTVTGSTDNGIDIYGDSGAVAPTGRNFRITNNRVTGGSVGIFVESSEKGLVTGNYLTGCTSAGVVVNRISSRPTDINIVANTISGGPVGVRVTGDMRGISIRNLVIAGVTTAGVQLGSGTGNSAYVWVLDNTIDTATQDTVPLVLLTGNQAAFIRIRGTITKNTNRGLDTANQATTSASVTISPANAA